MNYESKYAGPPPKPFRPRTLTITVETPEDADALERLFGPMSGPGLVEYVKGLTAPGRVYLASDPTFACKLTSALYRLGADIAVGGR